MRQRFVWLCVVVAALRIIVYSLAFPPFNNVDEFLHFDVVMAYSHGLAVPTPPRAMPPETLAYVPLYASPEYLKDQAPAMKPMWQAPDDVRNAAVARFIQHPMFNLEVCETPLYYALAGAWTELGRLLGLGHAALPYWIRLFGVFIAALLIVASAKLADRVLPERPFVRYAVPALLALWPLGGFYGIQNDTLTAALAAVALLGLARWLSADRPTPGSAAGFGLSLALLGLAKTSTLPMLAVIAGMVALDAGRRRDHSRTMPLAVWALCAGLPLAVLGLWNLLVIGDPSGTSLKIQALGWTVKPLATWWPHPLFTPAGLVTFWKELLSSFWLGELVWHLKALALPGTGVFVAVASLVGMAIAPAAIRATEGAPWQRQVLWVGYAGFWASIAYLFVLSLSFDYHDCFYPSREHPMFTSGRLIVDAAPGFMLALVVAFEWALVKLKLEQRRWALLVLVLLILQGSEIAANARVFASLYNAFRLLGL